MSYLVLARKYRPATFADVVGQEHVVRTLQNAITLQRVHHAFLFTGARGVGKTTCARVLAKALNCDQGMRPDPCGTCGSCTEIAAGTHPDVLEIDGASNTGVDNVRELRETVRYLPSRGRFKLYIIDEVHMLSTAAFNALLKTLEEPPPHVKFIFATTEPQKIPITILSRCQRFDFRRVAVHTLAEHLRGVLEREGVKLGPSALTAIVREAQGSVRDALSLLDQALSAAGPGATDEQLIAALGLVDRHTIFELFEAVITRDAAKILRLTAEVDTRGHELADVAALLVDHLRDVMVVKLLKELGPSQLDRSPGEIEQLRAQAARVTSPELHRMFAILVSVADDVARSPFPRVSFEMGLLRLLEVEPAHTLSEVVTRLDQLVSGGAGKVEAKAPRNDGRAAPPVESRADSAAPRAEAPAPRPAPRAAPPDARPSRAEAPAETRDAARPAHAEPRASAPRATGWPGFVERVRSHRPALASVLEHGRCVAFGPAGVEIGYALAFYFEKAKDQESRDLLQLVLAEHFGQSVNLSITRVSEAQAEGDTSIAEQTEQRKRSREEQIRAGALDHPAVKGAISILGGEIKEVIVREELPPESDITREEAES